MPPASRPLPMVPRHAGALFGDFLPALSRSRRGSAEVWAFDPNSKALDLSNFGSRSRGLGSPEDSRAGSPLMIAFRGLREEPRAANVGTRVSDCTPPSATLGRWSATCVPLAPRDRGVDIKNAARTRHDIVGFGSIARGRFDVSSRKFEGDRTSATVEVEEYNTIYQLVRVFRRNSPPNGPSWGAVSKRVSITKFTCEESNQEPVHGSVTETPWGLCGGPLGDPIANFPWNEGSDLQTEFDRCLPRREAMERFVSPLAMMRRLGRLERVDPTAGRKRGPARAPIPLSPKASRQIGSVFGNKMRCGLLG